VFNAVLDGSDAVMLSGESAVGEYPVEAVATMRRICAEAEVFSKSSAYAPRMESVSLSGLIDPITEAAADAACLIARRLDAALIVVTAESGRSALALSNRRPSAPVLALARTEEVARRLSLCWGVEALLLPDARSVEQQLAFGMSWAKSHGLVRPGQHAVLLRSQTAGQANTAAILAGEVP
jgi:pyruvate kinase